MCADDGCNLLFLRRPGESAKCPACQAALPTKPKKKKRSKLPLLLLLLLFLGLLGSGAWYWNRNRLVVRPAEWTGPEGSRFEFHVIRPGLFGFGEKDVTPYAVALSEDPRVLRPDPATLTGLAGSRGKTTVHFHYQGRLASTSVTVTELGPPEQITIEPQLVELGVGTTQRLRLVGHYPGGVTTDLTGAAEWIPLDDAVVYAAEGLVEGVAPGTGTVAARLPYRQPAEAPAEEAPDPSLKQAADGSWYRIEFLEASANVSVSEVEFASIDAAVIPGDVALGSVGRLRIDGVASDGRRYNLLESSRLDLTVEPPYVATPQGTTLQADQLGRAQLRAKFGSDSGAGDFEVVSNLAIDSLVVVPESYSITVGEIADLSVASPQRGRIDLASSDPAVLQVTAAGRLIGRSEGNAEVNVRQGGQSQTVHVSVYHENVRAIEISPSRLVVPVDHTRIARIFGRLADGRRIELAPDAIKAETLPSPLHADFDPRAVALTGRLPTTTESPQQLTLRWADLDNTAPVEVVVAPLRLELTPHGPVDLPLGANAVAGGLGQLCRRLPGPASAGTSSMECPARVARSTGIGTSRSQGGGPARRRRPVECGGDVF